MLMQANTWFVEDVEMSVYHLTDEMRKCLTFLFSQIRTVVASLPSLFNHVMVSHIIHLTSISVCLWLL